MARRDQRQLDAVSEIIARIGDGVVASYLYGSGAREKLRPASDIDIFVLLNRSTSEVERRELVKDLLIVSGRHGSVISGRPVEVTMALIDNLRPWPAEPIREFQFGEWLRREYLRGYVPGPVVDFDLAPQVATLLAASVPLVGPPASELLEPVPADRLADAMRQTIPSLMNDIGDDTVNVLLTLARISYTIACGRIVTKDEAADWAILGLADEYKEPLAYAAARYLGHRAVEPEGFKENARRTAEELRGRIDNR